MSLAATNKHTCILSLCLLGKINRVGKMEYNVQRNCAFTFTGIGLFRDRIETKARLEGVVQPDVLP